MDDESQVEPIGPRPKVSVPSLMGAAAGILLLGSLSGFLSELSGERLRAGGLGISFAFEALGVLILVVSNGRRSYTAGATLAALGLIPLVFFTFFDLQNQTAAVSNDVTLTATIALLVAAALWIAGHLFGPSRSHVLFLGAALVAIWLAITIQVVDEGAQPGFDRFSQPAPDLAPASYREPSQSRPFDTIGNSIDGSGVDDIDRTIDEYDKYDAGQVICEGGVLTQGDPTFWECDGDEAWPIASDSSGFEDDFQFEEIPSEDEFGTEFDSEFGTEFDSEFQFDDEYYEDGFNADYGSDVFSDVNRAGSRFGWTTLVFGLIYLGGGALFDRAGDTRRGTAFFAVAAPLTITGPALTDLGATWKYGLMYLLVGCAAAHLGTGTNRRFTSWSGTLMAAGGVATIAVDMLGDGSSGTAVGFTLLIIGLAVALVAHALDDAGGDHPDLGQAHLTGGPHPGTSLDPATGQPSVPPLVPPPASQSAPTPVAPDQSSTPGVPPAPGSPDPATTAQHWGPPSGSAAPAAPGSPPAFDPRPPGSDDPLPR